MFKFSVLTLTKNPNLVWLRECLSSVSQQEFEDYEHIILDCSDGLILHQLELMLMDFPKVRLVKQSTVGFWPGFVEGYSVCTGEFVVTLNSDDLLFSEKTLSELNELILKGPICDLVYGRSLRVDKDLKSLYSFGPKRPISKFRNRFVFFNVSHHAVIFRRNLLDDCSLEDFLEFGNPDLAWMYIILDKYPSLFYNGIVARFRLHGSNLSLGSGFVSTKRTYSRATGVPSWFYVLSKLFHLVSNPSYLFYILRRRW